MDDSSTRKLVSRWADGRDVSEQAKMGVSLTLSQFVPPTDTAAVLTIEEDDHVIAALNDSALSLVQGAAVGEDDAPAADLRVLRLERGRASLNVSARYHADPWDKLIGTFTWTLSLPDGALLTFTTRHPWNMPPGEDERLARAVAEALGCPLS